MPDRLAEGGRAPRGARHSAVSEEFKGVSERLRVTETNRKSHCGHGCILTTTLDRDSYIAARRRAEAERWRRGSLRGSVRAACCPHRVR